VKIDAAVVRDRGGSFRLETLELDEPRSDEVVAGLVAAGMGHTDPMARRRH
jgi:aryl-alcohol dehydrogenase